MDKNINMNCSVYAAIRFPNDPEIAAAYARLRSGRTPSPLRDYLKEADQAKVARRRAVKVLKHHRR